MLVPCPGLLLNGVFPWNQENKASWCRHRSAGGWGKPRKPEVGQKGFRKKAGRGQKGRVSWEVNYQRDHHRWGKHPPRGVIELWRRAQAELERAMGTA